MKQISIEKQYRYDGRDLCSTQFVPLVCLLLLTIIIIVIIHNYTACNKDYSPLSERSSQ